MKNSRKLKLNRVLNFYIGIGVILWVIAAGLILTPLVPTIVYTLYPEAIANETESLTLGIDNDSASFEEIRAGYTVAEAPEENPLPKFDSELPVENLIIIPAYGVNAVIQEGTNAEAALDNGPWRVNDFGTPDVDNLPTIIPSHRWGVIGWTNLERREKSFIRLPELQNGDTVEVVWEQRKYIYEVYLAENNTEITDYDADLILYTCQFYWPSPERIFRYAERIN